MSREPREGMADHRFSSVAASASGVREMPRVSHSMLSGFSHQCRNSLSGIQFSLYLFKRQTCESLATTCKQIEADCMAVEKYFDRLQMVYQTMNLTVVRTAIGPWLDDRAREWQACLERVGKSLVMDPPPHDVTCEFDPHYLALALDAMVAWRAKRSDGSEARFTWGAIGDDLIMEWREEGLGTTARSSDLDDATTGGSHCSQDSASVTMVVLKRIVATHGGTVSCSRDQDFRLQLRWPTRQRVSPNA